MQTSVIDNKMNDAWNYIWKKLFLPETNLFYDYLSSPVEEDRFRHLPSPEEIKRQFPNPGGWGTGMEDSMLNAGSVMDILRLCHDLIGDKEAQALAEKVLDGIRLCCTVHGKNGFVARSVSPYDRMSCYFNSSRDQFTLAVYGLWRFVKAFPGSPDLPLAKKLLVDIASYCETFVTEENGFNLLRLDGKQALVSDMLTNAKPHEIMRLPMIYAAAWDATQDLHWHGLYVKYAIPGIEANLLMSESHPWWDIELGQMQVSLALLSEVEKDSVLLSKYAQVMRKTAFLSETLLRRKYQDFKKSKEDFTGYKPNWRRSPMTIRGETFAGNGSNILYGGYTYLMPKSPSSYAVTYDIFRSAGNLFCACLLCRDFSISAELEDIFTEMASALDYNNHGTAAPINLLHAYWLGRSRDIFSEPHENSGVKYEFA